MKVFAKVKVAGCFVATISILGCGGDNGDNIVGSGSLVTVSGFVLSIDNGAPALGTRVYLLDNEDKYSAVIDANAQYSIDLPAGSDMLLVVDDADPALTGPAGSWFKLLNYDVIFQPTVPEGGLNGYLIHGCPQTKGQTLGSIAVWDNYLANGDDANGNLFSVTNSDNASIISCVFLQSTNGQFSSIENMSVTIDESDYFVAYARFENVFSPGGPDATLGPNAYYPASRIETDPSGFITSFVTSRTDEITLNIIDSDQSRGLSFKTPNSVPVRPNMITLLLPGAVDGVTNKSPFEVFDAAGFFNQPSSF